METLRNLASHAVAPAGMLLNTVKDHSGVAAGVALAGAGLYAAHRLRGSQAANSQPFDAAPLVRPFDAAPLGQPSVPAQLLQPSDEELPVEPPAPAAPPVEQQDKYLADMRQQLADLQLQQEQHRLEAARKREEQEHQMRIAQAQAQAQAEARRNEAERALLEQKQLQAQQEKLIALKSMKANSAPPSGPVVSRVKAKESEGFPTLFLALLAVLVVVFAAYMAISNVQ
jgi:hypothetical protein